jgi:hypothetical protein
MAAFNTSGNRQSGHSTPSYQDLAPQSACVPDEQMATLILALIAPSSIFSNHRLWL